MAKYRATPSMFDTARLYGRLNRPAQHRADKRIPTWEHVASWFANTWATLTSPTYA